MKLSCRKGFSLIELLIVVLIIGVLSALLVRLGSYAWDKANRSTTQAEIHMIANALEQYKQDNGDYTNSPTPSALPLLVLYQRGYLKSWPTNRVTTAGLLSPFYKYYSYQCPGAANTTGFDIWTVTPSGTNSNFSRN